MKGFIL